MAFAQIWWNSTGPHETNKARGTKHANKYILGGKKKNSDSYADERHKKQRDIFVQIYFAKDTIYTDQTGKFPVCLLWGSM